MCTSQVEVFHFCRYFSLQATEPLGMSNQVRVEIEVRICNENGPEPDSFLPAQLIAYDTMNEARQDPLTPSISTHHTSI